MCVLRINETKVATENAFNRDQSGIEDYQEQSNDILFQVILEIRESLDPEKVYLRFLSINCFTQLENFFPFPLEAHSILY